MELYNIEELAKKNREIIKSIIKEKGCNYIEFPKTRKFDRTSFMYFYAVKLLSNNKLVYYYTQDKYYRFMFERDMKNDMLATEYRILCKVFNELNKL